jgi:hypothetical protein
VAARPRQSAHAGAAPALAAGAARSRRSGETRQLFGHDCMKPILPFEEAGGEKERDGS